VKPLNILIVDDQPGKLVAYEAMLAELGENLIKASTPSEALARLLRDEIAVILMDVSMPEMSGFELAAMIREHPRHQRTAIIFVSAIHLSDGDMMKGYERGAVDYVSVPVIPEILRAKIRVFSELFRKTEQLEQLNDELEQRVRSRTTDLEASLERLRESETRLRLQAQALAEADRRKDEFLAMLAHELRNPLAPICNALELLRRVGQSPQQLDWIRSVVDRQVRHLVRLVDDLLDANRISRGKILLAPAPVDLNQLVLEAVESVRSEDPAQHQFEVSLAPLPIVVHADAVRLTQVFVNLLGNAMKFTPKSGQITVSVRDLGDHGQVRVEDTGQGMAADELEHIFEMFYQGGGAIESAKGGVGLGLTLVEKLVTLHGGTVSAASEGVGRGSQFTIRLPASERPKPDANRGAPAARASRAAFSQAIRILVVDDNRDAAESLARLLRMDGAEVTVAYNGDRAVELASSIQPEVALLDIGMPVLDGYAAARAIRGRAGGDGVLLVAMTGWGQEDDKRRTREAGFDAHLVKPVALDALMEVLASGPAIARMQLRLAGPAPGIVAKEYVERILQDRPASI
jgi:signal transduction histidine kinase